MIICDGDSYMGFDSAGIYQITTTTDLGCDSIINLELDISVAVLGYFGPVTICKGDVLEVLEVNYEFDTSGTYIYEIEGPSGCIDLILTITVEVTESVEKYEEFQICEGDLLTYEGIEYEFDSSGVYDFEIFDNQGCLIQILQFDITIISPAQNFFDLTTCDTISVSFNGQIFEFDSTGIYNYFIIGPSGCNEAELIIDVTVIEPSNIETDTTICEGQSYDGYEVSGVYEIETIDPETGCPMINTLTLTVLPLSDPECTTNTSEFEIGNITIYPIPASEVLIIESESTITKVSLYSSTGRLLSKLENQNAKELKIDVSDLPIGFHLIMIETIHGRIMKKVIISR